MEAIKIISAYILDLALGDPRWLPHPVRLMGRGITALEEKLRNGQGKFRLRLKGAFLTIVVIGGSAFITHILLVSLKNVHPVLGTFTWILLAYTSLATKDLIIHARGVLEEIRNKNMEEARQRLSLIVGRDTQDLDEEKITCATIESIAENTNDGIIAPLFYLILFGPVLAIAYKAINTLDSMIGYKNERYIDFGWFAAKLDDAANFIPSRIAGFLIAVSAFILGKDFKNSFRIMLKDSKKHPSVNSGVPEAAMAGALGIRLGGPSSYAGKIVEKPYIGQETTAIHYNLITKAINLSFLSSFLMVSIGALFRWAI